MSMSLINPSLDGWDHDVPSCVPSAFPVVGSGYAGYVGVVGSPSFHTHFVPVYVPVSLPGGHSSFCHVREGHIMLHCGLSDPSSGTGGPDWDSHVSKHPAGRDVPDIGMVVFGRRMDGSKHVLGHTGHSTASSIQVPSGGYHLLGLLESVQVKEE